jgi:hypothetical protein
LRERDEIDEAQADLFEIQPSQKICSRGEPQLAASAGISGFPSFNLNESDLETIKDISLEAYTAVLHAYLSELPVERDITHFIKKILAAAHAAVNTVTGGNGLGSPEARIAADKTCFDRGDPSVLTVLNAAYKTSREIERLLGLLRFTPLDNGLYAARCAPDCFVLPALAEHFCLRFGDLPWAIIDEKRGLCLVRLAGEEARLESFDSEIVAPIRSQLPSLSVSGDEWEDLWRLYHHTVNIENRKNPELQRQLMPARYWKYLPELKKPGTV